MSITGLKKTALTVDNSPRIYELDELFWYVGRKPHTQTHENVYVMTMVSRSPRQIAGFDVAFDKSPERIQKIVDSAPEARKYCTDGWSGYADVVYPGQYVQNVHDKSDTFTVEGVNADLRHYIPILARRSRCFARKIETLRAVVAVFADAYNRFGAAKLKYRQCRSYAELPFSVLDYL